MRVINLNEMSSKEQLQVLLTLKDSETLNENQLSFDNVVLSNIDSSQLEVLIEMIKQNIPLKYFEECYNAYLFPRGLNPKIYVNHYVRIWIETAKKNLIDPSKWEEWENYCYKYCSDVYNIRPRRKDTDLSELTIAINIMFILKNSDTKVADQNLYYEIIKQFNLNIGNLQEVSYYSESIYNSKFQTICYIIKTFCPEHYERFKQLICYEEVTESLATLVIREIADKLGR